MSAKYEFIDAERATRNPDRSPRYQVKQMCAWLKLSTSGYHEWRTRPESATAARRVRLTAMIEYIFAEHDGTHGYRRIHAVLARRGYSCCPDLVRAVMQAAGLVTCQPRQSRMRTTPRSVT